MGKRGGALRDQWTSSLADYTKKYPDLARRARSNGAPATSRGMGQGSAHFPADPKGIATRESGGKVLNQLAKNTPWLVGGSADLYPSTKTLLTFDGAGQFEAETMADETSISAFVSTRMGAIANGMTLSKLRTFTATFFNFNDYMKPSVRLSAIMEIPVIHIYTHDSISLGEDGPTHQPIEQLRTASRHARSCLAPARLTRTK